MIYHGLAGSQMSVLNNLIMNAFIHAGIKANPC